MTIAHSSTSSGKMTKSVTGPGLSRGVGGISGPSSVANLVDFVESGDGYEDTNTRVSSFIFDSEGRRRGIRRPMLNCFFDPSFD